MSVPQYVRGRLSEEFPESDPKDVCEVLKCSGKFELAEQWASGKQENNSGKHHQSSDYDKTRGGQNKPNKSTISNRTLDDSLGDWVPAQKRDGKTYRDKNRCYKCGEKSWSTTCKINP